MRRKAVIIMLVCTMLMMSFSGCGKNNTATNNSSTESGASGTTAPDNTTGSAQEEQSGSNFNETGYPIVNESVTLNVMLGIRDVDSLIAPNEMDVIKTLEEETGIHVEWEIVKGSDWETKTNLMFASGEYPDIIMATTSTLDDEEYGVTQQLVVPVEDLIDKYMPNYTSRVEAETQDPTAGLVASDGHTYSVGYMVGQYINTNQHFFINQTWLDALGMAMPTSLDELTAVLTAFATQDPNGNGENDEVALEMGLDTGFYSIRYMLPMFGVPCDPSKWIYIDDNKQVQLTPVQNGFRECMEWLHTMYTEGILDTEVISQDINTIETKLKEGNVGFFTCWRLTAMGFDDGVMKDCVLYTPVAPEGEQASMYKLIEMANDGAYITCTNDKIPESMRWLDALLEKETMFSLYYGPNGWEYNAEGKIESTTTGSEEIKDWLDCNTLFFAPGSYISSVFQMSPQRIEKTDYCKEYEAAGVMQKYSNDYLKLAPLTSEQIQGTVLTETDINNAVIEYAAKFIIDGVTDTEWDKFVNLFGDMGADDYISVYQNAIDQLDME